LECVIYIFTLSTAYPIGSRTRFIPVDGVIPYTVIIVAVLAFFFHMAFIGLLIGRQARENNFKTIDSYINANDDLIDLEIEKTL
jgi:hypothetical protein